MRTYIIIGLIIALIALTVIDKKPIMDTVKHHLSRFDFVQHFKGVVQSAARNTGLFPSLFMAQAILESADAKGNPGASTLASKHNNFFGIKADSSWNGPKAIMKTREVINGKSVYVDAAFRKYDHPIDSFKDRVNFLLKHKRYTTAGVFNSKTPEDQANALQRAGYATDPKYAQTLINLINRYNLKSLDV